MTSRELARITPRKRVAVVNQKEISSFICEHWLTRKTWHIRSAQECVCEKGRNVGVRDSVSLKVLFLSLAFLSFTFPVRFAREKTRLTNYKIFVLTVEIRNNFALQSFYFSYFSSSSFTFPRKNFFFSLFSVSSVCFPLSLLHSSSWFAQLKTRRAVWRERAINGTKFTPFLCRMSILFAQ